MLAKILPPLFVATCFCACSSYRGYQYERGFKAMSNELEKVDAVRLGKAKEIGFSPYWAGAMTAQKVWVEHWHESEVVGGIKNMAEEARQERKDHESTDMYRALSCDDPDNCGQTVIQP